MVRVDGLHGNEKMAKSNNVVADQVDQSAETETPVESKRPRLITIDIADDIIVFNVAGETPLPLHLGQMSDDIKTRAMVHGIVQKVSDAAAGSMTPAEKRAAMDAVVYRLNSGEWNKRSGDGTSQPSGLIARAVAEFSGKPLSTVQTFLGAKTRSEVLALRKVPEIATIMDRLRAETPAAKAVDTSELLAGLMD